MSEYENMNILLRGAEDYSTKVTDFLKKHGIRKVIGFSGSVDIRLEDFLEGDPLQQQYKDFKNAFHKRIIVDILKLLKGYNIAVLTGGTKGGIPELAATEAKTLGLKTIGVYPRTGKKYCLDNSIIDLSICVEPLIGESRWGDEGAVWTTLVDAMIVINGQAGTLTECAHIQKINEALIKNGSLPKYIIPIYGTGGIADQLPYLWAKPEIKNKCMPLERIYSGKQAADFIIENLDLEYDY
jgi:predicted Rossmann-fold nucleotide-binding protein